MATNTNNLYQRAEQAGLTPTMVNLLVALMVLLIVSALLTGILVILRQRRRSRSRFIEIPSHKPMRMSTASTHSFHRRTNATLSTSIHVFREKQFFFEEPAERPTRPSALPEIRITFPEEVDDAGKTQSGRVVVVHVGDSSSLGFEPAAEQLPAYQLIDLEKVGGLQEREARPPLGWS